MAFKFKLGRGDDEGVGELDEETRNKITKGEMAATELEALRSAHEATKAEFDSMRAKLAELESATKPPLKDEVRNEPTSFYEDPDRAFNERMTPLILNDLRFKSGVILERIAARHPDWKFFASEIQDMHSKCSLQQQCDEAVIENIYYIIKGRHSEEIREGKFVVEAPSGSGNSPNGNEKDKSLSGLSPEQLRVGRKLGIKDEDLAKTAAGLRFTM